MSSEIKSLAFAGYTLDLSQRQLRRGHEVLPVTGKTFDLLAYMAANPGRPLLKSELLSAVWPDSFVEESNLSQNVFLLRKVLGSGPEGPIVTLPGRGYQFAAAVTDVSVPSLMGEAALPGMRTLEATQTRLVLQEETEEHIAPWRSLWVVGLAFVGLILLAMAGWLGWERWEDRVGGPPVQLVMADLEGTTGDTALDQALTAAERIDLAQSPFVTVLPVSTVQQTMTQMMHKPQDPLPPELARELCERTASQAVLRNTVARSGDQYLLTAEATNCVDGLTLGAATQEARTRDEIPRALDKLTATLRQRLGESRRTIARYSAPLFPANTGSIEALELYTQATNVSRTGKMTEAIGLLNRAVSLDPQFAAAYLNLANFYASVGDKLDEQANIDKAYTLRTSATEPIQLYIVAHYTDAITGDLYAALRNYETWTEIYPRDAAAWSGMSQVQRELGNHQASVAAEQHAIAINPHIMPLYYQLSLEQMHAGDAAGAQSTCELALSRGLDGELLHSNLFMIAYLQHNSALLADQETWAASHTGAPHVFLKEMDLALSTGRIQDAKAALDSALDALRQQGLDTLATAYARESALGFAEIGETEQARKLLHQGLIDTGSPEELLALVEVGEASQALALVREQVAKRPQATVLNRILAPEVRAAAALASHSPKDAVAALETTRGFEAVALEPTFLRGKAYLQLGQPKLAETEFRYLLQHRMIDPLSQFIPLSELGVARALAQQGATHPAQDAYKQFLSDWPDEKGDQPLRRQAAAEASALLNINRY
jgi:DNA-binding winged helix-turn-helix (wHTH) protein/tetratricopeptide (TPR) repeat protein